MRALYIFPVVSPDETHVVWHIETPDWAPAELVELSSSKVISRWVGFFPYWSSDGKSLVFSRCDGRNDGVWVCDLEKGKAAKVVDDWICYRCSWAPNTGQIALCAYAHAMSPRTWVYSGMWGSIWIAPLDYSVFGAGSSAPIRNWPGDESDTRSLMQMLLGYNGIPERKTEAEQLYRRLIELLDEPIHACHTMRRGRR
jgi:WD40 repeat protein